MVWDWEWGEEGGVRWDEVKGLGHVGDFAWRAWSANARGHPQVAFHIDANSVAAAPLEKIVDQSPMAQLTFRGNGMGPNLAIAARQIVAVDDVQGLAVRRHRNA